MTILPATIMVLMFFLNGFKPTRMMLLYGLDGLDWVGKSLVGSFFFTSPNCYGKMISNKYGRICDVQKSPKHVIYQAQNFTCKSYMDLSTETGWW
jgi:hypothetical protein